MQSFSGKFQTLPTIDDLRRSVYWTVARTSFGFDPILHQMSKVSWDIRDVKSQHSHYVDLLLRVNSYCLHERSSNDENPYEKSSKLKNRA